MKSSIKYYLIFISCCCIYGNCNKSKTPSVIAPTITNLKTKTLSEIKSFLDGNWQMHYMTIEDYSGGKEKTLLNDCFLKFFSVDSIKWTIIEPPLKIFALDKIQFIPVRNNSSEYGYYLIFKDSYNQDRYLIPDRTINDTLVLFEDGYKANYYLTRK